MPYIFTAPTCKFSSIGIRLILLSVLFVFLFSSIQAQTSESYKWNSVAIGGGGFVSGLITSKEQPGLMYARTDVGGAYKWDSATNTWLPLMDGVSEQQQGILGTESLAIDPQNPNVVYISAGISYFNNGKSYILRSTDYGANFTITEVTGQFKVHGNGMGRQNGEKLQVDPNNSSIVYCGTRWNGLFKSTNFGATWSRVTSLNVTTTPNENGISFVVLDKTSAATGSATQRIFVGISRAGNNQNLYMSSNGGTDFSALVNPNLAADLMPQRAVLSGDGNLIITYGDGAGPHGHWSVGTEDYTTGQIWKYNIASGTWTNVTPAGMNKPFSGISVDPANPQRLVASTINTYMQQGSEWGDRFFISTNGGTSWTDIIESRGFTMDPNGVTWLSKNSIHWAGSIEFDPANTNRVLVTSGNGIFINEDINSSKIWKFSVKGLEETVPLNLVSIPDGPLISVIGDYDGFRHVDIKQYAPIHNPTMGTTTGLDYAVSNKNKVVRVGTSMYYSGDMGLTWTKTAVINGTKGQVALSADGSILLHSPDGSSTSYRSTNNGSSWTTISGLSFSNARPVADGVNPNKFYAYDNGSAIMMLSTNGGATFVAGGNPGSGGSRVIRTVPGREGHIWVALYGNGLSRSINSGATFTKLNSVTQCAAVGIGKAAPGSAYETIYIYGTVSGVLGIHRSIDEGVTWVRVNDDAHEYGGPANGQFVVGDMNVYGQVYMSTAGRGIAVGTPIPKRELIFSTPVFNSLENSVGGTVIGTPSISDPTETNLHNWSIVSGNTNNVFSIEAATGKISISAGAVLDYETKPTYELNLSFLDKANEAARGVITINVDNINEAPTEISLSKSVITQNNAVAAVVGSLSSIDADANSTFTYTLVSGTGSADNTAFTITGADLKAGVVFNFATKPVYNIRVKTTDNAGLSFEKAFVITINKLAGLPVTNFKVKAINELCSTNNDGKITITAVENLTYKATLTNGTTNTEFTFSNSLDIPSLTAGTYTLCITAEGIANYKQCFDLTLTEPQPLSVYSSVNESDKSVVLNLAGASLYQIELNGKTFSTGSNSITLNLVSGSNNLVVSTDKNCQGMYKKSFFLNDGKLVYPNPFDGIVHINMGNDSSEKVKVSLYTLSGSLAFSKEILATNPEIDLELSSLNSGTYIMKIKTEHSQSSSKLIKK